MKEWYLSKEPNERRALLIGTVIVIALLLYSLGWKPLTNAIQRNQGHLIQQQETLQWMRGTAQKIKQLSGNQRPVLAATANQPLLSIVENTAKTIIRSGGVLKRVEPKDRDTVQVWLDQASFDEVIRWLNNLQRNSGIHATNISLEKQKQVGVVNARITLKRGA